ncbi:hypothetical protein [Pararhodobacter sp.]|uniref:hypothetical protein n=1 Tax=Pararhodobacter sp. TaxID=2127056 RepID=UPI002AFDEBD9|nr:hypothetical protein [Pararhodobacter sp.]
MRTSVVVMLVAALTVTGCSTIRESRMNPRNWFGASQEERPSLGPVRDRVDNRALVTQVTAMTIEPTSSGALVRAEAMMPSAGWWDGELVPQNFGRPEAGVLTLHFVAAAPREAVPDTGAQSRTLIAVYPMSQAQLDTVSSVVVTGETNSRSVRR